MLNVREEADWSLSVRVTALSLAAVVPANHGNEDARPWIVDVVKLSGSRQL